ncbi:MAG: 30S ribosome-binding factor RbfA [Candidatus Cloacimonetes bacterium]|nr:30S ribosome-binding factor RbfA [Candidatus Cloacimonadota bacterium]MCF7813498.1 30S ribosome-binding factor RbfA [Candidatus Cloacimonadota bacterium]MCF7868579.1 30S ribosome-binding factor RbfA [Candidatus Cloacimonadota bacterium]MCF7883366.1 30S ribosome-binding factor RbfA [Candidatus Cloacimonadota bacterium]
MPRIRIQRLESELFKLISTVLTFKVRDKDLQMVNVTEVKLTNDLAYAKIYYTTLEPNVKKVQLGLERSKGFIKKEIAAAKFMRIVPELIFKFDDKAEKARRLDEIFAKIHQEEADTDEN